MSFLCCDCCLNLFGSKKNKNTKAPYLPQQAQQLDEEELMTHKINNQAKSLPSQYLYQQQRTQQQNDGHSQTMNVQLELSSSVLRNEDDKRSQTSSKQDNQQNNSLSQKDHSENENQQIQQTPTEQKLKPDYTKFSINLDPYDNYYKLLHQKTQNLEKYFGFEGKDIELGLTKSNLKITKIDVHKFQIRFQLPCSYSFYSMLMKDSNTGNKKYMSNFDKFQILQAFKPNFTKNVIKMKRYSMLEPRQFVYLKYSNGSFKQNWQICINESEEDLLSGEPTQHKRCDIFSIGNFKQINQRLYVRQYVQIDLKASNMNANMWGKLIHQVKEYFQKVYVHVQNYYQKELL